MATKKKSIKEDERLILAALESSRLLQESYKAEALAARDRGNAHYISAAIELLKTNRITVLDRDQVAEVARALKHGMDPYDHAKP
jgi:hypothetical protein